VDIMMAVLMLFYTFAVLIQTPRNIQSWESIVYGGYSRYLAGVTFPSPRLKGVWMISSHDPRLSGRFLSPETSNPNF